MRDIRRTAVTELFRIHVKNDSSGDFHDSKQFKFEEKC